MRSTYFNFSDCLSISNKKKFARRTKKDKGEKEDTLNKQHAVTIPSRTLETRGKNRLD